MNRERAFAIIVRFFAVGITAAAIVIAAGIVWLALSAQNRPKELTLVAVLLITAGTVIVVSLTASSFIVRLDAQYSSFERVDAQLSF